MPKKNDEGAECPKCGKCGGVTARQDAYVNHSIPSNGKIDWDDKSDVATFDDTVYECFECGAELKQEEIEKTNSFEIA